MWNPAGRPISVVGRLDSRAFSEPASQPQKLPPTTTLARAKKKDLVGLALSMLVLIPLLLLEYGGAFGFYFMGDDFDFIEFIFQNKANILTETPVNWHYYPLGILLNTLPAWFGSLDPALFVLTNFLLFFSCCALIIVVYRLIVGGMWGGFWAALIYATAIPNSEVIYWKTGNQTIAMTVFSLLALYFFIRYRETGSKKAFGACWAVFALSMLCIEQGIVTFGILVIYDLLFWSIPGLHVAENKRKGVIASFVRRHGLLLLVPVLLTLLKLSIGIGLSPYPLSARPSQLMQALLILAPIQLLDFNHMVSFVSSGWTFRPLSFSILAVMLGYTLYRRSVAGLFLLCSSVSGMTAIVIASGAITSRYFCLPLVFFASYLSWFLIDASTLFAKVLCRALPGESAKEDSRERMALLPGYLIGGIICCVIVLVGLRGNLLRREYWNVASTIEQNIVESIQLYAMTALVPEEPEQKIYLLNVPHYIWSKKHSYYLPLASNSLVQDLRHRLGEKAGRISLIATARSMEISIGNDTAVYKVKGQKNMKSWEEIHRLIEDGHIILRFSPAMKMLVPLGAHTYTSSIQDGAS
jgi:hypothetical protein